MEHIALSSSSHSDTFSHYKIRSFSFFANAVFVGCAGWFMELFIYYRQFGRIYDCGFLLMPWCPIYAVGICTILLCVQLCKRPVTFLKLALISGLSITALEAICGIVFRQFGLTLWNYSRWPLSNRYISLPASIGWSLGGAIYLSYVYPFIAKKEKSLFVNFDKSPQKQEKFLPCAKTPLLTLKMMLSETVRTDRTPFTVQTVKAVHTLQRQMKR